MQSETTIDTNIDIDTDTDIDTNADTASAAIVKNKVILYDIKKTYRHAVNRCLENKIRGRSLYKHMEEFTQWTYKTINFDYDGIIIILRAGLPLGLKLYELTNKPVGFVSASRNKNLSINTRYKNIPEMQNPLIVDSWIATGSTIAAVAKRLKIENISLFGVIATTQALNLIKPDNYVIGYLSNELTEDNYIVPPDPFKPRDIGDDLFSDIL